MAKTREDTKVETVVMSEDDIQRTLLRMAHEIVERQRGANDLVLVGIPTRGLPLARRLADGVGKLVGKEVPVGCLDIRPFRDDLSNQEKALAQPLAAAAGIEGKKVIIVDDVLFTGRSTRAALDALTRVGRPRQVQLAVLVDRGHRELPIRADYVGKNVPTSLLERVQVRLKEVDGVDAVVLIKRRDR